MSKLDYRHRECARLKLTAVLTLLVVVLCVIGIFAEKGVWSALVLVGAVCAIPLCSHLARLYRRLPLDREERQLDACIILIEVSVVVAVLCITLK